MIAVQVASSANPNQEYLDAIISGIVNLLFYVPSKYSRIMNPDLNIPDIKDQNLSSREEAPIFKAANLLLAAQSAFNKKPNDPTAPSRIQLTEQLIALYKEYIGIPDSKEEAVATVPKQFLRLLASSIIATDLFSKRAPANPFDPFGQSTQPNPIFSPGNVLTYSSNPQYFQNLIDNISDTQVHEALKVILKEGNLENPFMLSNIVTKYSDAYRVELRSEAKNSKNPLTLNHSQVVFTGSKQMADLELIKTSIVDLSVKSFKTESIDIQVRVFKRSHTAGQPSSFMLNCPHRWLLENRILSSITYQDLSDQILSVVFRNQLAEMDDKKIKSLIAIIDEARQNDEGIPEIKDVAHARALFSDYSKDAKVCLSVLMKGKTILALYNKKGDGYHYPELECSVPLNQNDTANEVLFFMLDPFDDDTELDLSSPHLLIANGTMEAGQNGKPTWIYLSAKPDDPDKFANILSEISVDLQHHVADNHIHSRPIWENPATGKVRDDVKDITNWQVIESMANSRDYRNDGPFILVFRTKQTGKSNPDEFTDKQKVSRHDSNRPSLEKFIEVSLSKYFEGLWKSMPEHESNGKYDEFLIFHDGGKALETESAENTLGNFTLPSAQNTDITLSSNNGTYKKIDFTASNAREQNYKKILDKHFAFYLNSRI
jgi:hypothetical protein